MVLIFNNIKENTEKKLFDVVCSLKKKKLFRISKKKKVRKKKLKTICLLPLAFALVVYYALTQRILLIKLRNHNLIRIILNEFIS